MQSQQTDRAFITITTVPSLGNCTDCQTIASSYEEEGKKFSFKNNFINCIKNCFFF